MSFLSRSYERHFNERPYLNHTCYLFITKTTRERTRQQSTFNTLCRGYLTPKEVRDKDAVGLFLDAVGQAESIINESGLFKVERLSEAEIVGAAEKAGILEKYFALTQSDTAILQEFGWTPDGCRSAIKPYACTRCRIWTTCRKRFRRTAVSNGSRRIEATAACRSRLLWGCCCRATISTTSTCGKRSCK